MTCQGDHARLGDYVDGALPATEAVQVEAHLATCAPCRSLAADLQRIRSMARSLEPLVPPPHVWRAVAAATQRRSPWASLRLFVVAWQPAAATAMAAVLATGLWWLGDRLSTPSGTAASSAAIEAAGRAAFGGEERRQGVPGDWEERRQGVPGDWEKRRQGVPVDDVTHHAPEVQYTSTIARLEALTRTERAALDPALVDVLDSGMDVIDAAIDQSRAAVQANPESDAAQESLFQALRTKVALLQDTLALVNDRSLEERR
jgi:hypothetical protein